MSGPPRSSSRVRLQPFHASASVSARSWTLQPNASLRQQAANASVGRTPAVPGPSHFPEERLWERAALPPCRPGQADHDRRPRRGDGSREQATALLETSRSLFCQPQRRPPAVHQVVLSGHLQSTPVRGIGHYKRPERTGADWSGHRSITRNEGVPGSSPGVGSKSPAERQLLLPLWATRSTSLLLTNSGVGTICREFLPVKVLTTAQELLGPAEQGRSRCAYGLASAGASFSTYQKSCKPLSS
jgi:hypothetical protein